MRSLLAALGACVLLSACAGEARETAEAGTTFSYVWIDPG